MTKFSGSLSYYLPTGGPLKAASNACTWVLSSKRLSSISHFGVSAASTLKDASKALVSADAATKPGGVVYRLILNRLKAVVPSVKRSAGELSSPTVAHALVAAGSYLKYFIPLKDASKALVSTDAATKLGDIAYRLIVKRLKAAVPSVKRSAGELLSPTVAHALAAAGSYLIYFTPDTTTNTAEKANVSHYGRLVRLHKALINSGKVRAAQSTISNSYEGIKNQLTTLSTVIAKARYEFLLLPISITIAIRVNVHCGAALIGITAGDSAESTLTVTKPT